MYVLLNPSQSQATPDQNPVFAPKMGLRMENVLGKRIGTRLNENPHSVWSPAGSKLCPNFLQLPPGLSKSLVFHEMKPQKKTNHIYNGQLN